MGVTTAQAATVWEPLLRPVRNTQRNTVLSGGVLPKGFVVRRYLHYIQNLYNQPSYARTVQQPYLQNKHQSEQFLGCNIGL